MAEYQGNPTLAHEERPRAGGWPSSWLKNREVLRQAKPGSLADGNNPSRSLRLGPHRDHQPQQVTPPLWASPGNQPSRKEQLTGSRQLQDSQLRHAVKEGGPSRCDWVHIWCPAGPGCDANTAGPRGAAPHSLRATEPGIFLSPPPNTRIASPPSRPQGAHGHLTGTAL